MHITQFLSFPNVLQLYWVALSFPMGYFPMLPGFCWSLQSRKIGQLEAGFKAFTEGAVPRLQRGDIEKSRDLSMISKKYPWIWNIRGFLTIEISWNIYVLFKLLYVRSSIPCLWIGVWPQIARSVLKGPMLKQDETKPLKKKELASWCMAFAWYRFNSFTVAHKSSTYTYYHLLSEEVRRWFQKLPFESSSTVYL